MRYTCGHTINRKEEVMPDIRKEVTIHASIAEVWDVWDDFGAIANWHPGLRKSALLDQSPATGIGAKRRCDFADGKHFILEEIVDYQAGKSMAVHIFDGNIPVQTSKVTFSLDALGPDKTRLSAEVDFQLRGGVFGSIAKPLAKKQLGKDISKLLQANKTHVEGLAI
jgi:uncharacterized protein YndB with AHSA1/START domain